MWKTTKRNVRECQCGGRCDQNSDECQSQGGCEVRHVLLEKGCVSNVNEPNFYSINVCIYVWEWAVWDDLLFVYLFFFHSLWILVYITYLSHCGWERKKIDVVDIDIRALWFGTVHIQISLRPLNFSYVTPATTPNGTRTTTRLPVRRQPSTRYSKDP